ncbi:MAG TPA: ammonium transporter [Syntrophobacteraceae bacterium]|nr:ammonium transporter [Syntrophobacteraceae bacterium]
MKNILLALVVVFIALLATTAPAEEKGMPVQLAQATQPAPAPAAPEAAPAKIDSGDTAWILASSALVLLMTPGLALFYGGMVRRKNVLGTIMHSFVAMGIISIQWVLFGYSLAFGPDIGHFIGNLDWIGLNHVGLAPNADYGPTVPHQAYMIFQMMFAIITPALISGAIAERMKFSAYCIFLIAWATFVYDPLAHWVWGAGGWLHEKGALDFAGGLVVHISSGISALACALMLGKRKGYRVDIMAPHNLTLTILGACLLWFGWFGFNAGSAVAAGELSTSAFVGTHIATAAAAMSWMFTEWIHRGKPTALGAASGAVAGLVAITPASGFIAPLPALLLGIIAGALCYGAVNLKSSLGYDDSLDVVGVHGIGGTIGALFTGFFATKLINAAGGDGLFYGNPGQVGVQALSVVSAWVYSFVVTFIILKVIDAIIGLRLTEEDESTGLDLTQHGEVGYTFEV